MSTTEQAVAGGVSFALSDDQKALRDLAHEFTEREIRPKAAEYDEHQTHAAEVVAKAHEIGLMNLHVPEACGGPELGHFEGLLVGEELFWGCSGMGTTITANGSQNSQFQLRCSTMTAPETIPTPAPIPRIADTKPMLPGTRSRRQARLLLRRGRARPGSAVSPHRCAGDQAEPTAA